ncbi:hypothetical protein Tco_0245104, partial [Tanacetum coccineum]
LTLLGDGIKSARTGDKALDTGDNAGTDVIGDLRLLQDGPADDLTMGVSEKNQMKHPNENLMMPLMMNLKKNDRPNVLQQDDEWVGDGGVSGVSLSVVSSSDDKNGEIAGNGGIWSDDGSLDGSGSESDAGE